MQRTGRIRLHALAFAPRLSFSTLLVIAALAACGERPTQPARAFDPRRADAVASNAPQDGRYLVLARPGGFTALDSVVAALGGRVDARHDGAGLGVVSGLTAAAAMQLAARSDIVDVAPDVTVSLGTPVAPAQADATAIGEPAIANQANPTLAARYAWQWNMRDIGAPAAWSAGKLGDAAVSVAILDTGIDYDDPDLAGLVDLTRSTSFVPSDDQFRALYFPTRDAISDFNGHGTNVAEQVSSNAKALAGVTSHTTLMGVKVLGWNGGGAFSGILDGLLWAADHGADVANLSLGGAFAKRGNGQYTSIIMRVVDYAYRRGMLIVAAAGNDGLDLDHDGNLLATFCDAVQVVCVSAVGPATATSFLDTPSYYTNFGRSAISVAAPGGNAHPTSPTTYTLSSWPWGTDIASWVWSYCSKTRLVTDTTKHLPVPTACVTGNRLTGYIGTSQATPHVSGLAALLVAEHGHGQPGLIRQLIESSAVDLGAPGVDPFYGHGRISVPAALGL